MHPFRFARMNFHLMSGRISKQEVVHSQWFRILAKCCQRPRVVDGVECVVVVVVVAAAVASGSGSQGEHFLQNEYHIQVNRPEHPG